VAQSPRWLFPVLIGANAFLALAFFLAQGWESVALPCTPQQGCFDERIARPLAGGIAAILALTGVWLGWRLRRRAPPAAFVVPPLLTALFAFLVVRGQSDEWIRVLWWPLLLLCLADAILLVLASTKALMPPP